MTIHNNPLHNANNTDLPTDTALTSRLDETFRARSISGAGLTPPAAFLAGVARSRRTRTLRRAALAIAAVVVISGAFVYFSSTPAFAPARSQPLNPDAPSRPIATLPDEKQPPDRTTRSHPETLAAVIRDPDRLTEHSAARDADLMLLRVGDRQHVLSGGIALLR